MDGTEELHATALRLLRSSNGTHADDDDDDDTSQDDNTSGPEGGSGTGRRSVGDRLLSYAFAELAADAYRVDQFRQAHVLINGSPFALPRGIYPWLRQLMWEREGRGVSSEALQGAAGTIEAKCLHEGIAVHLHVRSAWHDDALYVELEPGKVCRIDGSEYALVAPSPVLFRRYVNLQPLPIPTGGGNLDAFIDLILPLPPAGTSEALTQPVTAARRLLRTYLVLGLHPDVARPILLFLGPQGAGKTSRQRLIKWLLDPTKPESLRLDQRDFLQKVAHAQVCFFDNLSALPEWALDAFCRLVTGESDSKRVLYSDDQDFIYELRRLILLNGINPPGDRPDFADRTLPIELRRIDDGDRREEEAITALFADQHAGWLGATFTLLSKAIKLRPGITPDKLPRLADWGRWACAVYAAMDEPPGQFWTDWQQVVERQHAAAIDGSPVAQAVIEFMRERTFWKDTPGMLHAVLSPIVERLGLTRSKEWPKDAKWLGRRLREVGPVLAALNITVTDDRDASRRFIEIRKGDRNDDPPTDPPDDPIPQAPNNAVSAVMSSSSSSNQGSWDDNNDHDDMMHPDDVIGKTPPNQGSWPDDNNDDIFGQPSDDDSDDWDGEVF